jgi:DNA processing protein
MVKTQDSESRFMSYRELTPEELLGPLNDFETKHAPGVLFVAGSTELLQCGARVAIVGSRKPTPEGIARARRLSRLLAQRGDVVVSGLGMGIDTAAHEEAIASGGKTIAVLGTPLDEVSPRENASLQELIMREHLAVSQFPCGKAVGRGNFPLRNRTMALLSDATVIVEAQEGSGTLHQGWEAIRLGRGLFIAKSTAENPVLSWPKEMLHYGAEILADGSLEVFFDHLPPRRPLRDANAAVPF